MDYADLYPYNCGNCDDRKDSHLATMEVITAHWRMHYYDEN